MAISIIEYQFLSTLYQRKLFPDSADVLEFGEQHWHGDVSLETLTEDIRKRVADPELQSELLAKLDKVQQDPSKKRNFDIAKIVYKSLINYKSISAIDLHGTLDAYPFDLNQPVNLDQQFDVTINLGTGEHIFNIAQFFKTMHDLTKPQGLMLHGMPFIGWIDHGFYNFNPTLYWDMAASNHYRMLTFLFEFDSQRFVEIKDQEDVRKALQGLWHQEQRMPRHSMLYVALQKSETPDEFHIPTQGYFQISREEYWASIQEIARPATLTGSPPLVLADERIHLMITPDWQIPVNQQIEQLKTVLSALCHHPQPQQFCLWIDVSNSSGDPQANIDQSLLDPESLVSSIIMEWLVNQATEQIDIREDSPTNYPEISYFNLETLNLSSSSLKQSIYHTPLPSENPKALAQLATYGIPDCSLSALLSLTLAP
ncbi:MAG: hypothetical protein NW237_13095 [Cyanobacteriota bacterium]|nr:hypothetical protein [Cyanobacteriota bacterium]